MSNREHLLTIVEPTTGGDGTLDLADDTVARGGSTSVVVVITDRVQRDIRAFADSEDIGWTDAESQALEQFHSLYAERTGAAPTIVGRTRSLGHQLEGQVTPEVTAMAVPARLLSDFSVHDFTNTTGIPVIVAPSEAA